MFILPLDLASGLDSRVVTIHSLYGVLLLIACLLSPKKLLINAGIKRGGGLHRRPRHVLDWGGDYNSVEEISNLEDRIWGYMQVESKRWSKSVLKVKFHLCLAIAYISSVSFGCSKRERTKWEKAELSTAFLINQHHKGHTVQITVALSMLDTEELHSMNPDRCIRVHLEQSVGFFSHLCINSLLQSDQKCWKIPK